ncbi:MAG: hypothetical protein ACK4S4_04735 [Pyrinomonadaceae bacterium]
MRKLGIVAVSAAALLALNGCGGTVSTGNTNLTAVNANASIANSVANSNIDAVAGTTGGSTVEAREPEQYQANIRLSLQTMGGSQNVSVPTLAAVVARSGADRVMQFTLPNNEKVIYLDKAGTNYLILPNRRQYAELNKESLGFEVRRMLMPEQVVAQVKGLPGVKLAGEEVVSGREVVKYTYQAVTNTQTQAGSVGTESVILVDKQTGLPLRSETVSQTQSGANVQGVSGVRVVTEMTDISTTPDAALFTLPEGYQKIDPETVKAQVQAVFSIVGSFIGQAMNNQQPPAANSNAAANSNR